MVKEIVFATSNPHKVMEVGLIMNVPDCKLLSLKDIGYHKDIIEDGLSFEENAKIKVDALRSENKTCIIGEDSGLEVTSLSGAPGIYSARYAGEPVNHDNNIDKLLKELGDNPLRAASFTSVICFYFNDQYYYFKGHCHGHIAYQRKGIGGFGYDPVFIPENFNQSFAELSDSLKSMISHRFQSFNLLGKFIRDRSQ